MASIVVSSRSNAMAFLRVTVQLPRGAESREGGGLLRNAASPAATRNANTGRPCWRHDATTVNSLSAKRLPAWLSEPKLPFRPSTAFAIVPNITSLMTGMGKALILGPAVAADERPDADTDQRSHSVATRLGRRPGGLVEEYTRS